MECPVCNRKVNNLSKHFISMGRVNNDHKEFRKKYLLKFNDIMNSYFNSDLHLREIVDEIKDKHNIILFSINDISKVWKQKFGEKKYKERIKRLDSLKFKKFWNKRNKDEKEKTIKKASKSRVKIRKEVEKNVSKKSKKLLKLSEEEILEQIEGIKNFEKEFSDKFVQCKLCGEKRKFLRSHLIHHHNINSEVYRFLFPNENLNCQEAMDNQKRKVMLKTRKIRIDFDEKELEKELEFNKHKNESFRKVHERDKVCQECGEDHDLDVHHIIPRRLFSRYDKSQNDLENLILLCKKCHAKLGQKLDLIIFDIFEILIKFLFPSTYRYVISYLKLAEKSELPKKVGAPKKSCSKR